MPIVRTIQKKLINQLTRGGGRDIIAEKELCRVALFFSHAANKLKDGANTMEELITLAAEHIGEILIAAGTFLAVKFGARDKTPEQKLKKAKKTLKKAQKRVRKDESKARADVAKLQEATLKVEKLEKEIEKE